MKNAISLSIVFMLVFSLFPTGHTAAEAEPIDGLNVIHSSNEDVELELTVVPQDLQFQSISIGGEPFSEVRYRDWELLTIEGAPQLPFTTVLVGVPLNAEVSIEIIESEATEIRVENPILPASTQMVENPISFGITEDPLQWEIGWSFSQDETIYDGSEAFPGFIAKINNDGILRDQRIISVGLYPFVSNIEKGTLRVITHLRVRLKFNSADQSPAGSSKVTASPFDDTLRQSLINYDAARSWRFDPAGISDQSQTASQLVPTVTPWIPPSPGWKIEVNAAGLYSLGYQELFDAGFLADDPDPANISIYHQGEEIAIEVIDGGDAHFDVSDQILFYAPAFNYKYSSSDIYWLSINPQPGKRITSRSDSLEEPAIPTSFGESLHFEINTFYRSTLEGTDQFERFLWDYASQARVWQYNFTVNGPMAGPAYLTLRMYGYFQDLNYDPDHHIAFYLNNQKLGDDYWDGKTWETFTVDVSGLLLSGNNTIKVTCPNDLGVGHDIVFFDWFELSYPREFQAVQDTLLFDIDQGGSWKFSIAGFSNGQPESKRIYIISDANNVESVENFSLSESGETYTMDFETLSLQSSSFLTIDISQARNVKSITARDGLDLLDPVTNPELIIVSHADFLDEATQLAEYRQAGGTDSYAVDVQDIYDYFSFGVIQPDAIREFLGYALENWNTSYVLLFGDGHYDPKNYLGYGRVNYIPAYLAFVDPWWGESAADNRYVTLVGNDLIPDMMIGRISVDTTEQAAIALQKLQVYEQQTADSAWKDNLLSVADNADDGGNFPQIAEDLFVALKPDYYNLTMVHYKVTHTDLQLAKQAILDSFNSGQLIVNYIGHASYAAWSGEPLLSKTSLSQLTNSEKLPIILAMTCLEGFFQDPGLDFVHNEGLAETITRSSATGAIASWSSAGLGIATGHDYLNRGFLNSVFQMGANTLGEATLAGKINLWGSGDNLDLMDVYNLFGDPSLQIPRTVKAVDDQYLVDEDNTLFISAISGLLANDVTPGEINPTAVLVDDVTHGELSLNPDGSFYYTPDEDYFGLDRFTYYLYFGDMHSNTANVEITVDAVNDVPVAYDQQVITIQNQPISFTLYADDDGSVGPFNQGALSINSPDSQIETLTYIITSSPEHGLLTGLAPDLIFTPTQNYYGEDQFTFKVSDGEFESNIAVVSIVILQDPNSPLAIDDEYSVDYGTVLQVDAPGVLTNDQVNREGGSLSSVLIDSTPSGTLLLSEDGGFTFTPQAAFSGSLTFSYMAIDGPYTSNPAFVTIIVKQPEVIFLPFIVH